MRTLTRLIYLAILVSATFYAGVKFGLWPSRTVARLSGELDTARIGLTQLTAGRSGQIGTPVSDPNSSIRPLTQKCTDAANELALYKKAAAPALPSVLAILKADLPPIPASCVTEYNPCYSAAYRALSAMDQPGEPTTSAMLAFLKSRLYLGLVSYDVNERTIAKRLLELDRGNVEVREWIDERLSNLEAETRSGKSHDEFAELFELRAKYLSAYPLPEFDSKQSTCAILSAISKALPANAALLPDLLNKAQYVQVQYDEAERNIVTDPSSGLDYDIGYRCFVEPIRMLNKANYNVNAAMPLVEWMLIHIFAAEDEEFRNRHAMKKLSNSGSSRADEAFHSDLINLLVKHGRSPAARELLVEALNLPFPLSAPLRAKVAEGLATFQDEDSIQALACFKKTGFGCKCQPQDGGLRCTRDDGGWSYT